MAEKQPIQVILDKCTGCTLGAKNCPVEAIDSGRNLVHVINQERCINCGTCFEVCPPRFRAVQRVSGEPVPPPPSPEERTIVRKKRKDT